MEICLKSAFHTIVLVNFVHFVHLQEIISIDLGSEFIKVSVLSSKCPMEIVESLDSKRKIPTAVAFNNGERFFGNDALRIGLKSPQDSFSYFVDLLGKPISHSSVKSFLKAFPYYELVPDSFGSFAFKTSSGETFSPEEILAMIFNHCLKLAQDQCEETSIRDLALSVPTFFENAEIQSVKNAVQMTKLNLIKLTKSPLPISLNYGLSRQEIYKKSKKNVLFFDMGASQTTVSIVQYFLVPSKDDPSSWIPFTNVLGVASDRNLGGLDLQIAMRKYFMVEFETRNHLKNSLASNSRALAKLLKETAKVKTVLSANKFDIAQIENLAEDYDFRLKITREKFLQINSDFFKRILPVVNQAMDESGLAKNEIHDIILFGGGTRVPHVQDVLQNITGLKIGKSGLINTDEAIAMGLAFQAAETSNNFDTIKFMTKDKSFLSHQNSGRSNSYSLGKSKQKIKNWDDKDALKRTYNEALNNLESEVINMKMDLDQPIYLKFSSAEERSRIIKKCNEVSEWFDRQNDDEDNVMPDLLTIQSKANEFHKIISHLKFQVNQYEEYPEVLEVLKKMIEKAKQIKVTKIELSDKIMASERIYDEASKMFNDIDYEQFPHQLATRILAEKASELENLIEANVESRSSSSDNSLDLMELVPGMIWMKKTTKNDNKSMIPKKFLLGPYFIEKVLVEEGSIIWAAVIVTIIHLLFHTFR